MCFQQDGDSFPKQLSSVGIYNGEGGRNWICVYSCDVFQALKEGKVIIRLWVNYFQF